MDSEDSIEIDVAQLDRLEGPRATAVRQLVDDAIAIDGYPSIGTSDWWSFATHGRANHAVFVATEAEHDHVVGYAHVRRNDRDEGVIELVVSPHHRTTEFDIGSALVDKAVETTRSDLDGIHLWVTRPRPVHDQLAAHVGLLSVRNVMQLRCMLEHRESPTLHTGAFVPGIDDQGFLNANNRAFAWHPDQSNWTQAKLDALLGESWFSAEGFRVYREDEVIRAFCITKVHTPCLDCGVPAHGLGEIFVIAVDPDAQGHGLGHQLVLAGLEALAHAGQVEAMLYVEESNARARALYDRLGFELHHLDRGYELQIHP